MQHSRTTGLAAGVLSVLALAVTPASGLAAPTTVDLRIEGPTRTLFEGPVTTDVRTFRFSSPTTEYTCDGTAPAGQSTSPVPTRGAAVTAASLATPFSTTGSFSQQFGSPSFDEIAGESVAFDPATNRFLAEYKNEQFAGLGACGDPIAPGDRVLFAYADGSEPLLALRGPATARPGDTVGVTVTNAADGQPVAGAAVGGQTTDAAGTARVTPAQRGPNAFKATKAGAIRSNALSVCATDGQDGACGTSRPGAAPTPPGGQAPVAVRDAGRPVGRVAGVREQQTFTRARAPRELRIAATDPSGVDQVKLRLRRSSGGRCAYLSKRKDRFLRIPCGRAVPLFKASDTGTFTYLLPERLTRGRYVLDVVAIDEAGNRDELARGRSRIVFTVR